MTKGTPIEIKTKEGLTLMVDCQSRVISSLQLQRLMDCLTGPTEVSKAYLQTWGFSNLRQVCD